MNGEFSFSNDGTGSYYVTNEGTYTTATTASTVTTDTTNWTSGGISCDGSNYNIICQDEMTMELSSIHKDMLETIVRPIKFLEFVIDIIKNYFDLRYYSRSYVEAFNNLLNDNLLELGRTFFPKCRFEMEYKDNLLFRPIKQSKPIPLDMIFDDEDEEIIIRFDIMGDKTNFYEVGVR